MNNYVFEFDSTQLPQNFAKFVKLNLKKVFENINNFKQIKNKDSNTKYDLNFLNLNKYKSVVIEKKVITVN